jgi:PAS domain S-box-containing protein
MRKHLEHRYPIALILAALLLLALVLTGIRSFEQMRESLAALEHTHRLDESVSMLDLTLLDMKLSQRRHLMTQEEGARAMHDATAARLDQAVERTAALVHPADAATLREKIAGFRAEQEESRIAAERAGPDAALAMWRSPRADVRLDEVRALLTRLEAQATEELATRQALAAASVRRNQWIAAALMGALALLLAISWALMRAEARARRRAVEADHRAMNALEVRVTERTRELEQAAVRLAVSEAHLRGIFDSANEAILSVSPQQIILTANSAAAQTFGRPVEQLVGMPLEVLIPARHRTRHRADVQAFAAQAGAARPMGRRAEVHAVHADGHEFAIEASISTVHIDGSQFHTVVLRDITARLLAHAQLREAEGRQRRLLASLPEAVYVESNGRITYANEAAQRLLGAAEAELLGRDPMTLVHPDSRPAAQERIAALLRGEPVDRLVELKFVRADGDLRWTESTATTMDEEGRRSIVVVLRDVTELRHVRDALAASHADLRRLMSAQTDVQERERARIARELHDDLQQTLAAIKMDLAAAADRTASAPHQVAPLLAKARELADSVIVSTRRIVNDLRPQLLDDLGLGAALQALASQFSQRTGVECEIDDRANGSVDALSPAAALCLFRVAQEALNNVAKHAQAQLVTITLHADASTGICLQVDDDGRGITDPDRHKTGSFGLPGMRERVASIGGSLAVGERPGGGTRVTVVVPITATTVSLPA